MTECFNILAGLPAHGPLPVPYPSDGKGAFREGLVVQFWDENNKSWIANIQRSFGTLDKVLSHPNQHDVIIVAGGWAFAVDPSTKAIKADYGEGLTFVELLPEYGAALFVYPDHIETWRADNRWWKTPRISWDGIRHVQIGGGWLTAEAYSPIDNSWTAFEVDILTGSCTGSIYEAQIAKAIKIVPTPRK